MAGPLDTGSSGPRFPIASVDPRTARATDVAAIGAVNQALYYRAEHGGTVSKICLEVTTSSGNISVAFYRNVGLGKAAQPGARIVTSGAVACPAVGYAEVSLGGPYAIPAGSWIAISADNATAAFRSTLTGESPTQLGEGWAFKAGASHPLPATAASLTAIIGRNIILVGE